MRGRGRGRGKVVVEREREGGGGKRAKRRERRKEKQREEKRRAREEETYPTGGETFRYGRPLELRHHYILHLFDGGIRRYVLIKWCSILLDGRWMQREREREREGVWKREGRKK